MAYGQSVLRHSLLGFEGPRVPGALRGWLREGLAGVVIYQRNWQSVENLRALCDEIRQAAGTAQVLIGIDQEGGTRFSLPEPFTQWPSPEALGRHGDEGLVQQIAQAMALELRAVGMNLNFAPMLDVHVNPGSPVTTTRSFGADPALVGRMGAAFISGLWREGRVLACAKHYPGHGDVGVDPHDDLPVSEATAHVLDGRDLPPFETAIRAGVPTIMTAHVLLKNVEEVPTSLSRRMLHDVLRERMGFGGVIFADDLGMGAIRARYGVEKAAVRALAAGSDIVMLCHEEALAAPCLNALQRAQENYLVDDLELRASELRIANLLNGAEHAGEDAPPPQVIGCSEHQALAKLPTG